MEIYRHSCNGDSHFRYGTDSDVSALTDFFTGLFIIPNMIAVIWLVPQVVQLQKEYFNTPENIIWPIKKKNFC